LGSAQYGCQCWSGAAKNTTGFPQPYSIIKRVAGYALIHPPYVDGGVLTTLSITTLVRAGMIGVNQVLASGQDIDLPNPTEIPLPLNNIGNNAMVECFIYASIGNDPFGFIPVPGLGTITGMT
jgi:hypothetical protein